MTAPTGADTDAPLPIDYSVPDDVDAEAAKVLAVIDGVAWTLEALTRSLEENTPPENLTQEHLDTLEAAFQTGQRLMKHHNYEAFLAEGPSALPEGLVDEIAENVAPVASAHGFEIDAGTDREDFTFDDVVTADLTRRGS